MNGGFAASAEGGSSAFPTGGQSNDAGSADWQSGAPASLGGAGAGGNAGSGEMGSGGARPPRLKMTLEREAILTLPGEWTVIMPFLSDSEPHFIAYQQSSGFASFNRLDLEQQTSSAVWADTMSPGYTAFARIAPHDHERFAIYSSNSGKRVLTSYWLGLQGPHYLDYDNTNIAPGFVHFASDVVPELGLPFLYWYNPTNGALLAEILTASGGAFVGEVNSDLSIGYKALAALDGRVLGFEADTIDVYDLSSIGGNSSPVMIEGIGSCERAVALKLDEWPLLICYSTIGSLRVLELDWSDSGAREIWRSQVLPDARAFSGLVLDGALLIFAYDPLVQALQVSSLRATP
jgi:hypothetical protein